MYNLIPNYTSKGIVQLGKPVTHHFTKPESRPALRLFLCKTGELRYNKLKMAKKKRKIVWHKRRGKFIPPTLIKSHYTKDAGKHEDQPQANKEHSRTENFAKDFSQQIKKAAHDDS